MNMNLKKITSFLSGALLLLPAVQVEAAPASGVLNRTVVFARFFDDPELDATRESYENMFIDMNSYFMAISNGKLDVRSHLYPRNTGVNTSFELDYCYYCYDSTWKGTYPNCKSTAITGKADINVAFVIGELAAKMEAAGEVPSAEELDGDGDGYVDNFVIVLRGAGRGTGKGIHSPHVGTVSETYTKQNGDIKINGKIIRDYTVTYERNTLETHSRFQLSQLGFPNLYPTMGSCARFVGMWDPMDGPKLVFPLAYNRMKYTSGTWIEEIPEITRAGQYSLAPATDGAAYRIASSDPSQFWVLEFRDASQPWEENIASTGLIIYRVNTAYTGVLARNSEIYVCRKDGTFTEYGNVADAPFSEAYGRVSFGPDSNPSPFLADGSEEDIPEITDIAIAGGKATFRVSKLAGVHAVGISDTWDARTEPYAPGMIQVEGDGIENLTLYSLTGQCVFALTGEISGQVDVSGLKSGVYVLRLSNGAGRIFTSKIIL